MTEREESLCQAYMLASDQSDAYRKSDYSSSGMSPVSINKAASKLFSSPLISRRVAVLLEERNKRSKVDADYVLKRLIEIDQMDLMDIMTDDLSIKPLSQWPERWRRTISSIDVTEEFASIGNESVSVGFIKKIRLPDKIKNLELLGRHIDVQAWKDKAKLDINATLTLEQAIEQARLERLVN